MSHLSAKHQINSQETPNEIIIIQIEKGTASIYCLIMFFRESWNPGKENYTRCIPFFIVKS